MESSVISPPPNPPERHESRVMRSVLSAAFFGAIGAAVGKWLGHHGNEPKRKMAEPIMTWCMGIMGAILAAYSSLKSSEQPDAPVRPTSQSPTIDATLSSVPGASQLDGVPSPAVLADTAQRQGMTATAATQKIM